MSNKISILSTVALDEQLIAKAAAGDILLDGIAFINVAALDNSDLKEEVSEFCKREIAVVFTSANAVRAISETVREQQPAWDIYCIGRATKHALLEHFAIDRIKATGLDAAALAAAIKAAYVPEVVFFCGDKRMDTLPELLRCDDVSVHEVVVYRTIETPQMIEKAYDAILFFSPSSVHSFFVANRILSSDTVLFAIGNTTATALQQHTDNKVIVSGVPSKEEMVTNAINYFQQQSTATAGTN